MVDPYERKSVVTRIILREEELSVGKIPPPVLWLDQIPRILAAVIDLPRGHASQMLYRAVEKYEILLENGSIVDRVLLRWSLSQAPGAAEPPGLAAFSWSDVIRYERPDAKTVFGEDRTCRAIIGVGDYVRNVLPDDLRREFSSKLPLLPSHFDGTEQLYAELLPGIAPPSDERTLERRIAQIVFPLPLDMRQAEDGRLTLRAPKGAHEGQMQVIVHFRPSRPPKTLHPTHDTAKISADGRAREWQWEILWPQGAESGKASLYYAEEAACGIDLLRWPSAGAFRAVIDNYFDPDHERLGKDLSGEDKKSSKDGKV